MANLLIDIRDRAIRRIRAMEEDTARKIADGNVSSFDEYKKQVGRVLGYREAIQQVENAFKEITGDDADD